MPVTLRIDAEPDPGATERSEFAIKVERDMSRQFTAFLWYFVVFPAGLLFALNVSANRIVVDTSGNPVSTFEGTPTKIRMVARKDDGTPLVNVSVTMKTKGGDFVGTGNNIISGQTDFNGNFTATWSCSPCDRQYSFDIKVSDGFNTAVGRVEMQVLPRSAKNSIRVHSLVTPERVRPNRPATINITTAGKDEALITGVKLELVVSGGKFSNGSTRLRAKTDSNGQFSTSWTCTKPCRKKYYVKIRAFHETVGSGTGKLLIRASKR